MQYINQFESQDWSVTDGPYYTLSTWNKVRDHQVAANQGYWAPHPFNPTSNWRNDKDNWCQENWCHSEYGTTVAGKENINSIRCAGAAGCKRGRQRRKPAQGAQCKSQCRPNANKPSPVAVPEPEPAQAESVEAPTAPKPGPAEPAPAAEPVSTPPAAAAENSAPPLLPEHLSLLAPFLSSNADSGSWRATCKDAKEALLPDGPYTPMLSSAGQAALVSLEKRKKLQKILVNARMLVSGLNFR